MQAVREGFSFKDKHLMMAWHKIPAKPKTPTTPKPRTPKSPLQSPPPLTPGVSSILSSKEEEEDPGTIDEEALLDDDPLDGEDLVGGPASLIIQDDEVRGFFLYSPLHLGRIKEYRKGSSPSICLLVRPRAFLHDS